MEVKIMARRNGTPEENMRREKNQTSISQDIEEKILSMYKGMTTGDIENHIRDIYIL